MSGTIGDVIGVQAEDNPFLPPEQGASYPPFAFQGKTFFLRILAEKAAAVVPTRDFLPVLSSFLVTVSPGRVSFLATDLALTVAVSTGAVTTTLPEGLASVTCVLPARRLLEHLKLAPGDETKVSVERDIATVTSGDASWTLHLRDAADFPDVPEITEDKAELPGAALLQGLRAVRHAVCRDASQANKTQVALSGGHALACDNSRAARFPVPGDLDIRIPAVGSPSAVDELIRMLQADPEGTVRVGEGPQHLVFEFGAGEDAPLLIAAKLDVGFPDVERMLLAPTVSNKDTLTVRRDDLAAAVRRVRSSADTETSAIGLLLTKDRVEVFAHDSHRNTARDYIDAGWDGEERLVVVNHAYLTDLIAACPAQTCAFRVGKQKGKQRPVLLLADEATGFTGIVQQMIPAMVGYERS